MDELKKYTPIIYHPGSYGTYLNFVLSNLMNKSPNEPFVVKNGSSHNFKSATLINGDNGYDIKTHNGGDFIKFHPKTLISHDTSDEINTLLSFVNKAIMIYPTKNSILLSLNNMYSKIFDNWLVGDECDFKVDMGKIQKHWHIDTNIMASQIERWMLREYMSIDMMPMFLDMHEWDFTKNYTHNKLIIITIDELLYEFNATIHKVSRFINIDVGDLTILSNIHKKMISLQQDLNKDDICKKIIKNFLNNDNFSVSVELSIIDEAWIQWELRNNGYEMYCNELNEFPKNLYEFNKHTYKF